MNAKTRSCIEPARLFGFPHNIPVCKALSHHSPLNRKSTVSSIEEIQNSFFLENTNLIVTTYLCRSKDGAVEESDHEMISKAKIPLSMTTRLELHRLSALGFLGFSLGIPERQMLVFNVA